MPRNLVNLDAVGHDYAARTILDALTLGVQEGDRIGLVGRNGEGKSTLLRLIAGAESPDRGAVTRTGGLRVTLLGQQEALEGHATVRDALGGDQRRWQTDARARDVLAGLLVAPLDAPIAPLSGGERQRIALARVLLDEPDLLLLDEPTNHLDVEGVAWLAEHLAARRGTLLVVTHDRWFLDAVCEATWEVADRGVNRYEGGYAAYVLARAERERQQAARDERRRNLLRKELAWLRRGPPARTAKPKFRIEAANALIADEPAPRDAVELLRFATARLGSKVLEAEAVSVSFGDRRVLDGVTWRLGPGDRVGLVGVNGSGKSTLMKVLAGAIEPDAGSVERGQTVRAALLTQEASELPGHLRVLEVLEGIGDLADRFGFRGDKARTLVRDLSGGERRRLQLMRLLMGEPNVLLLDEPTNDLDIDTLTAFEDLLDGWPGTLVVVSHDRYFVERVCDDVYALTGRGALRHLPGGIEQYLDERARDAAPAAPPPPARREKGAGGAARDARKEAARLEREMERLAEREAALEAEMAAHATDAGRLRELQSELEAVWQAFEELSARSS